MGTLEIDDHGLELIALALMNRAGISKIQHLQLTVLILNDPVITKINPNDSIRCCSCNAGDVSNIAVIDLLAVFRLHDLIANPETALTVCSLIL